MVNVFDRAQALEQNQRDDALAVCKRFQSLPATGQCYNCEEPLPAPMKFCDECCRDDYDKRTAVQKTGWARAMK